MKKILLTGGLGFIGTKLTKRLLNDDFEIIILDNFSTQIHGDSPNNRNKNLTFSDRVHVIYEDIRNFRNFRSILDGVYAVVHLAAETGTAQSMYEVIRYNEINSQGTAVILDCLINYPNNIEKFILSSSRSVYGEGSYQCGAHGIVTPEPRNLSSLQNHEWEPRCPICSGKLRNVATRETAPIKPASIYAATKYAQEELVHIACGAIGIDHKILRFQNVFGAGQSLNNPYTGILSIFSTRIRQKLSIPIFEDGLESRDFVHVDDVVEAIVMSLAKEKSKEYVFNVGSGVPTSVLEIANLLFDTFNGDEVSRPQITGQYRVGDIRHCYADLSVTDRILNWSPKVSLQNGIELFAEWVNSQPLPEDGLDRAMNELRVRKMTQ
jgi:dTDP-L-rhamnose 4-epimerase